MKIILNSFLLILFLLQLSLSAEEKNVISIEQQVIEQEKILKDIIFKIKSKDINYFSFDEDKYQNEINFLRSKITINKKEKNLLAVKRDQLHIELLKEKQIYFNTLRNISQAREQYKDKVFFEKVLSSNIDKLKSNSLDKFNSIYEEEKKYKNEVSKAFVQNYLDLFNQNHEYTFILEYLLNNIDKYRQKNFFIDNFNLEYLVERIDNTPNISFISNLSSYYLKFSVGEIIVVLFIILFFRLLNLKIISLVATFIAKIFVKSKLEDSDNIREYLKKSINTPLIFALYILAIHISAHILIKDINILESIIPWINTIYMALFTWALYAILNNSINIYAQNLLEKYPNVRKEMIVFILRILKVILVLLVLLFLFTQLGIDIKAIAASLGVGGIAIALASKDTLANFFGSLNIMTDNSFSQGDWIKTPDIEGTVVDIRMRTTRIRTFDNAMITMPNSQLANTHIMNWSKRKIGRRIKLSIGISYESSMKNIIKLKDDIHNMLNNHPHIASLKNTSKDTPKRFEAIKKEDLQGIKRTLLVYIDELDTSSINILVYCFSRSPNWEDWLGVKEDVLIKISELAEANHCELAYPTQAIFIKKDEEISSMKQELN
jgi:MscS family membrane protein